MAWEWHPGTQGPRCTQYFYSFGPSHSGQEFQVPARVAHGLCQESSSQPKACQGKTLTGTGSFTGPTRQAKDPGGTWVLQEAAEADAGLPRDAWAESSQQPTAFPGGAQPCSPHRAGRRKQGCWWQRGKRGWSGNLQAQMWPPGQTDKSEGQRWKKAKERNSHLLKSTVIALLITIILRSQSLLSHSTDEETKVQRT